jgi:hypothetical protein
MAKHSRLRIDFMFTQVAPSRLRNHLTLTISRTTLAEDRVVALVILASMFVCGCRDRTGDFKPRKELAESALVRALEDWKSGKPAGEIAGTKPLIHVTDTNRNPKQALNQFKILGEKPGRSGRTFAVELSLKHPDQQLKTEYIVVGIDPLWVYRREDFELLMHWDHRMPELLPETDQP